MIVLIVKESGQLLMGESVKEDNNYLTLKNVFIINLIQNEQGVLKPAPIEYPHPYLGAFVTKKRLDENNEYKFSKDTNIIFLEEDINQQTLNLYEELRASKSGIKIAKEMPKKNESNIILS